MKNIKKLLVNALVFAGFVGFALTHTLASNHEVQVVKEKQVNNVYTIDSYDSKKEIYDAKNSNGHIKFKIDVVDGMISVDAPIGQMVKKEKNSTILVLPEITKLFMIQSKASDRLLNAVSIIDGTKYLLDNKYNLGDIVEVTYHHDNIISEHKLTGKKLQQIENIKNYTTELVMVQSVTSDGYLDAKPVSSASKLKYGYILDNKYKLGDIVEITYSNDDLIKDHKVTGKKLQAIENKFDQNINALMEEGLKKAYVTAEDNSFAPSVFYR